MHTYGLRFDVNCSILFAELPPPKRPAAARPAGFDAVEFWWPFAEALGDVGGPDRPRVRAVRSGRRCHERWLAV